MPNWKKVITSGSNADLNIISGSNILISENATVDGDIFAKQYIKHKGDPNTFINFTENRIRFQAGGKWCSFYCYG